MRFKDSLKIFFLSGVLALGGLIFLVNPATATEDVNPLLVPCEVGENGEATCAVPELTASDSDEEIDDSLVAEIDLVSGKLPFVLFHLETCPHCRAEIEFIDEHIKPRFGDRLDIKMFEVSTPENARLFAEYTKTRNVTAGSVPMTFVGDEILLGYNTDETSGARLVELIESGLSGSQVGGVSVPILGRIDAKTVSLPLLTLVLGLLDGFNPCAMWVLLFLISLLLPMPNPRRRWLLGGVFILTSGLSYYVFMAAWLNVILFIGLVFWVRLLIGGAAVGMGVATLRKAWRNRHLDGVVCDISGKNDTKKIFNRLKDIVHKESLWLSLLGITLLGFSINLVELACSAGFPALFTQILALAEVETWQRYAYMGGYIIFYMFDDMLVFGAAMLSLRLTGGAGGRYAKVAEWISGALIFILGLLLVFKPEWLMFG